MRTGLVNANPRLASSTNSVSLSRWNRPFFLSPATEAEKSVDVVGFVDLSTKRALFRNNDRKRHFGTWQNLVLAL